MYYNHNLRVNLKEWRNRLIKSSTEQFPNSHKFFFDKLKVTPSLYCFLIESRFKPEEELLKQIDNSTRTRIEYENEEHEAITKYYLIQWYIERNDFHIGNIARKFGSGNTHNERLQSYVEQYIDPIVNFIGDNLDEGSTTLYLLEKYKLRTEWFFKDKLNELYQNNSATGENKLEEDLRLFLFDQGVDYPFSTPLSASGRADVVSMLHTNDPLVMEIKICDQKKNYRINRIADGFAQVIKYANDYHKNVGYLVVFNMDEYNYEISFDDKDKTWPPRLSFDGKNIYIIFVNIFKGVSASKGGKIKNQIINLQDLTANLNLAK
jgi:hypothetical protein